MKIALVIERFIPGKGGAEGYAVNLAQDFVRLGHEVTVIASKVAGHVEDVTVIEAPTMRWSPAIEILTFAHAARKIIEASDFDVASVLGKSLGGNVLNPHGGVEEAYAERFFLSIENPLYRWFRKILRYCTPRHYVIKSIQRSQYASADLKLVVAISDKVREDVERIHPAAAQKVRVLYNGVDLAKFHPDNKAKFRGELRASLGVSDDELVLLTVCHNFRLKGVASLIRAFALVRRTQPERKMQVWIVGRGKPGPFRRLARRLGVADSVRFLGGVSDVERYYAASDLFVYPTFFDACSLTVMEALASGLPVIATKHSGSGMLIEDGVQGVGSLDATDISGIANAIARFSGDDVRRTAGIEARKLAEKYPQEDNARKLLDLFEEISPRSSILDPRS
ncbi:MAG: glycosyltransferase family 4 protein [Planctomycetes bacterium]|nr:glycosyltransferase family 4 protein [Planctomycetota bacterium]